MRELACSSTGQLAFTLLVCAFLIVPVVLSIIAGVTENYFSRHPAAA